MVVTGRICEEDTDTLTVGVVSFFGSSSKAKKELGGNERVTVLTPVTAEITVLVPVAQVLSDAKATPRSQREKSVLMGAIE